MRRFVIVATLLVAGCQSAAAPTPIIIYLTPAPTVSQPTPVLTPSATAQPTVVARPAPVQTPAPTAAPSVKAAALPATLAPIAPTPSPTAKPKPTPKPTPVRTPKPWYPSGYTLISYDPPIAFRWLKSKEFSCSYSYSRSYCWGMNVIPQSGCTSLFVTLSIEDRSGTVIDSAVQEAQGVGPGQRAKLIFDTFNLSTDTAHIADVNCY